MKINLTVGAAISGALILIAGCNFSASRPVEGHPVVVDPVAVARALGRDEVMQKNMEQARDSINEQLVQVGASLQEQLQGEQGKLEQDEDGEKKQKLENLTLQARLQLRQTQQLAQKKIDRYYASLIAGFREEVIAVARKIASDRGSQSVMTVNADLLWFAAPVDITDEVIAELRAREDLGKATGHTVTGGERELEQLDRLVDSIASSGAKEKVSNP